MIDVNYWPTPNGWKVTIMLEECGLPYNIIPVDIGGGDQFTPELMANLGPMMGNANHFKSYGKNVADDPTPLEYGIKRFVGEVDRLSGVMDAQLSVNQYLAGADYIITWPWAMLIGRLIDEEVWESFPNLKRWGDEVGERPAVDIGRHIGRDLGRAERTEAEEKARRELLFNQTNAKVRKARERAAKAAS